MSNTTDREPDAERSADPPALIGDDEIHQPFSPRRVGLALVLSGALWVGPFFGTNAVLLPARLEQVAPDDKVQLVALLATVGALVALVANVLFGALSDLTRSRFGRRSPWMVIGSLGAAASLYLLSLQTSAAGIVITWCLFQVFLNAVAAAVIAMIPDRVPTARRGTFSALYGVGALFGAFGAQIGASAFVTRPTTGILVFAVLMLAGGPLGALIVRESSSRDLPRQHFSTSMVLTNFTFPRHNSRDFYFALFAKLLFVVGYYSVTGYQLFILTDYVGLSLEDAGAMIATIGGITLATTLVFGLVAGPFSDRIGRRKILIMGSAVLIATAMMVPFFAATTWAIIVFAVLGGIGNGAFTSLDQALNTEVLPSAANAAKDLGVLNMANTGGQILGPGLTSAVVGISGGYGSVFLIGAGSLVLSAALFVPIRRVR